MSTVDLTDNVQERSYVAAKRRDGRMTTTRKITMTAMLASVATVLMFFSVPVPIMPSFIKLDFSELPALIAAFTLGPVSGAFVCLVKNLVNLLQTTTGGVGEFCNFLLGVSFVVPAGFIYMKCKTFDGAIVGSITGCICMALLSLPINYYVVYPIYTNFIPLDGIVKMYQAINPKVETLFEALLWFNVPFTFFKGLCSVAITFIVYKPLSPLIKGYH